MLLRHLIVLMIDVRATLPKEREHKTYDQKDHLCLPNVPDSTRADGVGLLARRRMSGSRIHSLFTMTNSSAKRRFRRRRNTELSGFGGARRDRTDDLKLAKLPLSQLSYGPFWVSDAP